MLLISELHPRLRENPADYPRPEVARPHLAVTWPFISGSGIRHNIMINLPLFVSFGINP